MDTEKRFGIKKGKAILLFVQMVLVLLLLAMSIYLLVFVSSNNLGGWMIASYILILTSVASIILYAFVGYKKGMVAYLTSVVPFLGAILVNILLPQRNAFQVAVLAILFALTFAFLCKQKDKRFTYVISLCMVAVSLVFSIYSAITANVSFLGEVSQNWPTYLAMYLSIFVPVIMSGTFALTYSVRMDKGLLD